MKVCAFFCIFLFILQSSVSISAQIPETYLAAIRTDRIKADILQDIEKLPAKDKAYYYSRFGDTLLQNDRKEGLFWLEKAIDLGTNPATEYKDEAEKLSNLWNILSNILKEDAVLENKLLNKIKQIRINESQLDVLERANKTYILIAEQIISRKGDEKNAFEFAMLSLKGKKPAVDWKAAELFRAFKFKNENQANQYFAKLFDAVKYNNDRSLDSIFVYFFAVDKDSNYPTNDPRANISDAQLKEILEFIYPSIKIDAEALAQKKRKDCGMINYWGLKFSEEYKRLLPLKAIPVEQAIAVCQNADIEPWKKPYFQKRPRNSSQDWLNLAKEIPDKKVQAGYLENAASKARQEKNYRLSNTILEGIDKEFRKSSWTSAKIDSVSKWAEELFWEGEATEIYRLLDSTPTEYVPYIIVKILYAPRALKPGQKEFLLSLMETARAGFNQFDNFPTNPWDSAANPMTFGQLAQFYVKYGYYDEAVVVHEESIKSLNRLVRTLPPEDTNKPYPTFLYYSNFFNQLTSPRTTVIGMYFNQIYDNLGEIENTRTRLNERLSMFRMILEKQSRNASLPLIPKSGQ